MIFSAHGFLTKIPASTIEPAPVNFFRANLFVAIVSVFVLTGYAHAAIDRCGASGNHGHAEHGESAPVKDSGCECPCHQIATNALSKSVSAPMPSLALQSLRFSTDEFPPDAVPPGIDHPPQLA
jgi:hypothetical protein